MPEFERRLVLLATSRAGFKWEHEEDGAEAVGAPHLSASERAAWQVGAFWV